MPTRSLKQLKAAMPHGMEMKELYALLPDVFAAAQNGAEKPVDVAGIFLEVIDRAGENYEPLTPEVEQQLLEWVKAHWVTSPRPLFEMLCAVVSNLMIAEATSFLEEQKSAATDEATKEFVAFCLRTRSKKKAATK